MVLPDSHEISRVSQYSGTGTVTLTFEYGTVTLSGGASCSLLLVTRESVIPALRPRTDESARFGLFPVRSPLLGESRLISLPAGTEMFHFPALATVTYEFSEC